MNRHTCTVGFPSGSAVNNLPAVQETWVQPWIGKSSWRSRWQPISVFLPGKSCGQRTLVDCSPWGRKRAAHDLTTEHTHLHYVVWRQHGILVGFMKLYSGEGCPKAQPWETLEKSPFFFKHPGVWTGIIYYVVGGLVREITVVLGGRLDERMEKKTEDRGLICDNWEKGDQPPAEKTLGPSGNQRRRVFCWVQQK